jgi:hypothetical protein
VTRRRAPDRHQPTGTKSRICDFGVGATSGRDQLHALLSCAGQLIASVDSVFALDIGGVLANCLALASQ